MATPDDPTAFFREMVGQWQKIAGGGASPEGARTMQDAFREQMDRALAAANMPTRADVDALAARIAAIEASLARVEAHLGTVPAGRPD